MNTLFRLLIVSLAFAPSLALAQLQNANANSQNEAQVYNNNANQATPAYSYANQLGDNFPADHPVPDPLKPWLDWSIWEVAPIRNCATPFNNPQEPIPFWMSTLNLQATNTGAAFSVATSVSTRSWIPLPGDDRYWPQHVLVNGQPVPVVLHSQVPSVQLNPGPYTITGSFFWNELPPRLLIPAQIGILTLTLNGAPVPFPAWGEDGFLLLQTEVSAPSERDFLQVHVYRIIMDGVPMHLETDIVLDVSGKSREEKLNTVLPKDWKITGLDCPIPVFVDDAGNAKVQVRPGRWEIKLSAFSVRPKDEIAFASSAAPAAATELIGFLADSNMRLTKIDDLTAVDVSQTDFPKTWGEPTFPVYRWDTSKAFHITEIMRGQGHKSLPGLNIARTFWLDETGQSLVYQDSVSSAAQRRWRLNAAEDAVLGAVTDPDSDNTGMLITADPATNAPGVELRSSAFTLSASGTIPSPKRFKATGWQADALTLHSTLNLPPGWRLLAISGPDHSSGDWLTSWSIVPLFMVLICSLVIGRVYGIPAALLAFFALGLSYPEPQAPRIVWLFILPWVLIPHFIATGYFRSAALFMKWSSLLILILFLVPFLGSQVLSAFFPQLEARDAYFSSFAEDLERTLHAGSSSYGANLSPDMAADFSAAGAPVLQHAQNDGQLKVAEAEQNAARYLRNHPEQSPAQRQNVVYANPVVDLPPQKSSVDYNLLQDERARVQTGPAIPTQSWRQVTFDWSGPVTADESVQLFLLPPFLVSFLDLVRVVLLALLAMILLGLKLPRPTVPAGSTAIAAFLFILGLSSGNASADSLPTTLDVLKNRLLTVSTAYPNAAAIAQATVTLQNNTLTTVMEVHAELATAVPVPGKLPAWSPLRILVDGKPTASIHREDGYLWVLVPAGVHTVQTEGEIPAVSDWALTYELRPHLLTVTAPDWTYTGLRPDGTPEDQIYFTRIVTTTASQSDYGRQKLSPCVQLERHITLGHTWIVKNTLSRIGSGSSALVLHIPLLPGERSLSSNFISTKDGFVDVPLTADQNEVWWLGELNSPKTKAEEKSLKIALATRTSDTWVEKWSLVVSPIWDVTFTDLPPNYDDSTLKLGPEWHPWPGEKAEIAIARPQPEPGETLTITQVDYSTAVGLRELDSTLVISMKCTVAEDLHLDLPLGADVETLTLEGANYPVRSETKGNVERLTIPATPDLHTINLTWKLSKVLQPSVTAPTIALSHISHSTDAPLSCANVTASLSIPESNFVIWAWGPQQGPVVLFWAMFILAGIAAMILAKVLKSPLRPLSWFLLLIGLSQISPVLTLLLIAWIALVSYRSQTKIELYPRHLGITLTITILTIVAICVLFSIARQGLVGEPVTWILTPNGDSGMSWYAPVCNGQTPELGYIALSVEWYRFAALIYMLWLGYFATQWLRWTYQTVATARKSDLESPGTVDL